MKIKNSQIREIYFLLSSKINQLEYPCDNCVSFDCEKNPINKQLLKRYRWPEVVDSRACLKERRKELNEYREIIKLECFKSFRQYKCYICRKNFEPEDMLLTSVKRRGDKKAKAKILRKEMYRLIHICKACSRSLPKKISLL